MRNNIEDNITVSRAFQKAAYEQFILACYGHLLKENKYVCPLCAVVNVTTTEMLQQQENNAHPLLEFTWSVLEVHHIIYNESECGSTSTVLMFMLKILIDVV